MKTTLEQLRRILPKCKDPDLWSDWLNSSLESRGITTPSDTAMFIAQCGHESMHFNVLEENLRYSAASLRKVFPKYFPSDDIANRYAKNPQMIASRVYGGRMGNGPESTGDGYLYRGRGIIQITGKQNYTNCSLKLYGDDRLVQQPDLLLDPQFAVESACWYWSTRNINGKDIREATRSINGGVIGLEERTQLYQLAMRVLSS